MKYSCVWELNIVKMSILHKFIYEFNATQIKISADNIFIEIRLFYDLYANKRDLNEINVKKITNLEELFYLIQSYYKGNQYSVVFS